MEMLAICLLSGDVAASLPAEAEAEAEAEDEEDEDEEAEAAEDALSDDAAVSATLTVALGVCTTAEALVAAAAVALATATAADADADAAAVATAADAAAPSIGGRSFFSCAMLVAAEVWCTNNPPAARHSSPVLLLSSTSTAFGRAYCILSRRMTQSTSTSAPSMRAHHARFCGAAQLPIGKPVRITGLYGFANSNSTCASGIISRLSKKVGQRGGDRCFHIA